MKNFLLGFGIALIVISILFYIANLFEGRTHKAEIARMTDAIEELQDISATSQESNINIISDTQIVEMALALGMFFPEEDSNRVSSVEIDMGESVPESQDTTQEVPEEVETEEEPVVEQTRAVQTYVNLVIEPGSSAMRIAQLLESNGVIDNASRFEQFLVSNQTTTVLRAGSMTFPHNANYEDVLHILTTRQ